MKVFIISDCGLASLCVLHKCIVSEYNRFIRLRLSMHFNYSMYTIKKTLPNFFLYEISFCNLEHRRKNTIPLGRNTAVRTYTKLYKI